MTDLWVIPVAVLAAAIFIIAVILAFPDDRR